MSDGAVARADSVCGGTSCLKLRAPENRCPCHRSGTSAWRLPERLQSLLPRKARTVRSTWVASENTAETHCTPRVVVDDATATHQQNGQHCGSANGSHGVQNPAPVGARRSDQCAIRGWASLAVTTRPLDTCLVLVAGGDADGSLMIRPTVVVPRCVGQHGRAIFCNLGLAQTRAQ